MKPIFLIVIVANIILSCGKKKENNTNITEQDVFTKAPYDTTAIDSFSPGATSAIQRQIERAKAIRRADSLKKIAAEEAKKKEAEKLAEEKEENKN